MKTVQEIDRIIVTALVDDIVTAGYAINIIADGDSVITRDSGRAIEYILDLEQCTVNPVRLGRVVVDGQEQNAVVFSPGGILLTPGENGWDIVCNYTSNETIEEIIARADAIAHRYMLQDEASELHRLGDSALLRLIYTELSDLGFGSTEDINGADVIESINAWFGALDARFGG